MAYHQAQDDAPDSTADQQPGEPSNQFSPILHILPKWSCRQPEIPLSYLPFKAVPNRQAEKQTG
ncbi:hypothetical protein DOX53_10660 [Cronobacter malonaticus]|uniref:Uncharacterized protein n=1 Tax=Cronobacter malonaticus TaxID=413503 RepID=V5U362_9ENTR|nr:hypothetical protein P262_04838 [Cronobacter malonaticus]CCJ96201.1 FIG00554892: hypothetical protein [Cronobacter malonaticus 681]CCJ96731.1 FIG00554892: hypothetical protein [Cronobacter malonaticus 507]EGT4281247.1 hypothetical protein [Cronobacter malonaticus]EGT4289190.1 hypothetical protein [Cronobacter malonaticus]